MRSTWEEHKQVIRRYWIDDNKKLEEVVQIMKERHGFDKTKKAYATKFARWGVEFKKKRDASHWAVVGSKIQKRDRLKKKSNVMINGKLIPEDKLRKEISRHYYPSHKEQYGQAPSPRTPEGVSVFTPSVLPDSSWIFIDLPWKRFQPELMAIINRDSHFGTINVRDNLSVVFPSSTLTSLPDLLPKETQMRAILPVSVVDIRGPALGETAMSMFYYFNMMIYLISNNMPWINEDLLHLLEIALTRGPFLSLLHMRTPTTRAFIRVAFEAAIEFGYSAVISAMVDADVVLDAWKNDTGYPLHLAIAERETASAKRLIRDGASLKGDSGIIALREAVGDNNFELVSLLLEKGVDVNSCEGTLSGSMVTLAIRHDNPDNPEILQLLLDAGAAVDPRNTSEFDPVILEAARRGSIQMVQLLLEAGADINAASECSSSSTALAIASKRGDLQLAQLLIDCGAQINSWGRRRTSALTIAAKLNHPDLVRVILDAGAAVNTPMYDSIPDEEGYSSALYEAVKADNPSMVELLLKYKADPNIPAPPLDHSLGIRETALYAAVRNWDVQITQLLLQAGAKIDEISPLKIFRKTSRDMISTRTTALYLAVGRRHYAMVKVLLAAGATVNPSVLSCRMNKGGRCRDGWLSNTMHTAIQSTSAEIVRLLLDADPDVLLESGKFFLRAALNLKDYELTQFLIGAGVDINQVPAGRLTKTPLQMAVSTGDIHLTRFLINSGAYINAPAMGDGRTALQTAAENDNLELVQILLQHGADIHTQGSSVENGNALQLAACRGHIRVVNELLHAIKTSDNHPGPLDNHTDFGTISYDWRSTMLPAAARGGLLDIVELLLAEGADVDFVPQGIHLGTALHEAIKRLDLEMGQLLLSYHATPNIAGPVQLLPSYSYYLDRPSVKWYIGTPLQTAVEKGNMELIQLLMKAGAWPDVPTPEHENRLTPLEAAMAKQDEEDQLLLVQLLLAAGADVNMAGIYSGYLDYHKRYSGVQETALFAAVSQRHIQLVQVLLRAGADINAGFAVRPENGPMGPLSSLKIAVINARFAMRPEDGPIGTISPLQIAVALSDVEISKLLLDAGAEVKADQPFRVREHYHMGSMLTMAILGDNIELFHLLLDAGARVDTTTHTGNKLTPLQAAAMKGHTSLLEILLERGAEVDEIGADWGRTALSTAAAEGYAGIACVLLEAGADPNLRAPDTEWTALSVAATHGRIDIVRMLLNATSARGITGQTYIELLDSALARALKDVDYPECTKEVDNFAIDMIKEEIRGLKEA